MNSPNGLQHHGILGQKWGIRRYQNPDGTLTEAGKKRQAQYDKLEGKIDKATDKGLKEVGKIIKKKGSLDATDIFDTKYFKKFHKLNKTKAKAKIADLINDEIYKNNFARDKSGKKHLELLEQVYVNTSHFRKGKAYKEIKQKRLNEAIAEIRKTDYGRELLDSYANKYKESPAEAVKVRKVSLSSKRPK